MNIRHLKMFAIISALFFLSSCAVFVRDEHHHRRGWHHHSSLEQSGVQMTAQNGGDSGGHEQASR